MSLVDGGKLTCQICGFQIFQKTHLNLHKEAIHGGRHFQCSEYEYLATWKHELVRHDKSVHMGQKFKCTEFEYQATLKSNLCKAP